MRKQLTPIHRLSSIALFFFLCLLPIGSGHAQDYVTGSFEGEVKDSVTGSPLAGATVRITNQETGVPVAKQTDSAGRFRQGLLPPGDYTITVLKQGYVTQNLQRSLPALRPTVVLPPVPLVPESIAAATPAPTPETAAAGATPTPASGATPVPIAQPTTNRQATIPATTAAPEADIRGEINTTDAQRGGTFSQKEVSTLPLGATTLTRTFDELGLLLPGVALPPQTQGSVAGPGVGAGVGSAGQFAVNGLRSRANNFTVDGSDNNDEDIGVRRQGFLALVPQPIESIREFQMITLLAPAQYGRNLGAQVNAISKSGGNSTHGTAFGLFNSSQLNARDVFDRVGPNITIPLQGRTPGGQIRNVFINGTAQSVSDNSGAENSFTLGQGGLVLGGPLVPETASGAGRSLFYFVSAEGHILHADKEANFAVPTVEERGIFKSGATGILDSASNPIFPTSLQGDAVFSLFPFPNNPNGVYGRNTLTAVLPEDGRSKVLSGKVDGNFKVHQRQHALTARYNFTDDFRDISVTGGALFSSLRPNVRTQNFSTFLNSQITGPDSARPIYNQLRASYGRTRLNFLQRPNVDFLSPSVIFLNSSFLLNAPFIYNNTLPSNTFVDYRRSTTRFTELGFPVSGFLGAIEGGALGPVGQVIIAGYSPVGVDVFNFPQSRINNTYQLADTLTINAGRHNLAFGTDLRRSELDSDLPRNARPLIEFTGMPRLAFDNLTFDANNNPVFTNARFNGFLEPASLAAIGAASVVSQSLARGSDSSINLRSYQYNFFGQDEWRINRKLSLSYGLRYEYNTPAREVTGKIEKTFNASELGLIPGLRNFLAGRTKIYDSARTNFAPRVGLAFSHNLFGDRTTVFRAGYGIFYDQILGAVVSQSRNVFPSFLNLSTGGGIGNPSDLGLAFTRNQLRVFNIFNPGLSLRNGYANGINFNCNPSCSFQPFVPRGGSINQYNSALPLDVLINVFGKEFPGGSFGFTLPKRQLDTPTAQQYSVTVEQQLSRSMTLSASYVGTRGRHLLRLTTPNLGPNPVLLPVGFFSNADGEARSVGFSFAPGVRVSSDGKSIIGGRPVANAGVINLYDSSSNSRYHALQLQLRGRYNFLGATQFQVGYTYGKVTDDASDVFDLAGASALPQNSLTLAGERGPANFDVRHRVSSNYISDFSSWGKNNSFLHLIFNGLEVAGTGTFQTGQPFTVNSIFDVNLDGNLTDRLNSTTGIVETGDRSQPFRLTVPAASLLAPIGQDGQVPRNSFRAGNLWLTNAAVVKTISFSEHTKLIFRTEVFNFFNRANFGIPVRFLESPGFGRATNTVTPARRIQFGLKLSF